MMPMPATRAALQALVSAEGITFSALPILLPPAPYFDLAGEEFGARMLMTQGTDGTEFCLRPDFTLPIAIEHIASGAATPAAYGYLGPVFRQRAEAPAEFDQAGIELLALPDADAALERIVVFARQVLDLYNVRAPQLRVGDINLFEALLAACDMPDVWRPRIRARFGHPRALAATLDRLAQPHAPVKGPDGMAPETIAEWVSELMLTHGLSPNEGRGPEEIARRFLEKQALEAARVPEATLELLREHIAVSGSCDDAFDRIAAVAERRGIDLAAPLDAARARTERLCRGLGVERAVFDAGFSPRLDYYTGLTFEVSGPAGVLVSGGQYDKLLRRLGATDDISAVGCAAWVERLEKEAEGR